MLIVAEDTLSPTLPAVISRKEAKAKGLKRYFTGRPCKRGHVAEYYVTGPCVICDDARRRAWAAANREKLNEARKTRYAADPGKGRAAAAEYRSKHPDKAKAATAKWRAENSEYEKARNARYCEENRARISAHHKAWLTANRDSQIAKGRKRYWDNPELYRAKTRDWLAANPEKKRALSHQRRAREFGAEGFHTVEDIRKIHSLQKGRCAVCKAKVAKKFHVDHIQPLAKGGSNWPANLQILCGPCNLSKGVKDPIEYMQSLGMLF